MIRANGEKKDEDGDGVDDGQSGMDAMDAGAGKRE